MPLENFAITELFNYIGIKVSIFSFKPLLYINLFLFTYTWFSFFVILEAQDLISTFEIEIAVRVCYGSTDPDHISIAQDLLLNASEKFPTTSVIFILFSLFFIYLFIRILYCSSFSFFCILFSYFVCWFFNIYIFTVLNLIHQRNYHKQFFNFI